MSDIRKISSIRCYYCGIWLANREQVWKTEYHGVCADPDGGYSMRYNTTAVKELIGLELTVDHIVPRSRGGSHSPSNLCCCCRSCNSSKHSRSREEFRQLKARKSINMPYFNRDQLAWLDTNGVALPPLPQHVFFYELISGGNNPSYGLKGGDIFPWTVVAYSSDQQGLDAA